MNPLIFDTLEIRFRAILWLDVSHITRRTEILYSKRWQRLQWRVSLHLKSYYLLRVFPLLLLNNRKDTDVVIHFYWQGNRYGEGGGSFPLWVTFWGFIYQYTTPREYYWKLNSLSCSQRTKLMSSHLSVSSSATLWRRQHKSSTVLCIGTSTDYLCRSSKSTKDRVGPVDFQFPS